MKTFPALALLLLLAGCGGGSSSSAPNAVPIVINMGPPTIGYVNGAFTTVTVCVPGSGGNSDDGGTKDGGADCQTIDSVLIDTGSMGLRILSSNGGGELSISLPVEETSAGEPIAECFAFVDSYTWGPVRVADVTIGGEKATSVPVQVIGDPSFSSIPTSCSTTGGPSANTLDLLGAYGILGVGPFPQDCGEGCAESPTAANSANPGNVYYACASTGCQPTALAVPAQVQNPVSMFPVDNNGVVIDLSSVPAGGAASATGSLVFGIGTASNNGLGGATVLGIDPELLTFTTRYMGTDYSMSFIDSGSSGFFFLDSSITNLPDCTGSTTMGYYCPNAPVTVTATNLGTNGTSSTVSFTVADTTTLFANQSAFAYDDLGGPSTGGDYFDWGLPFFYGRKVFTSIEGVDAPGGTTPYFAY